MPRPRRPEGFRHCEICGARFYSYPHTIQEGGGRFCGNKCKHEGFRLGLVKTGKEARDLMMFLSSNFIPVPFSGCWLWLGPYDKAGYGLCTHTRAHEKGTRFAHRRMLMAYSPLEDYTGLAACHRCDVPACINPDHLFWGTSADNTRDAAAKGMVRWHHSYGSAHHASKLTEEQVLVIRSSEESLSALARDMGVSRVTISRIRQGIGWRHV